jgi:hypothetical protein
MSTTALRALVNGRVLPLVENNAIRQLRLGVTSDSDVLFEKIADLNRVNQWQNTPHFEIARAECQGTCFIESFWGARIFQDKHRFTARWITEVPPYHHRQRHLPLGSHSFSSISEAKKNIAKYLPFNLKLRIHAFAVLTFMWRFMEFSWQAVCVGRRMFSMRPRKISDRIGRGIKERALHSSDVANLIVLLITRSVVKVNDIRGKPKVVILGKGDALIMRLFIWLRILPMATVVEMKDRDTARQVAASVIDSDGAVLLAGNAYVRFYSDFADCPRDKVLIV